MFSTSVFVCTILFYVITEERQEGEACGGYWYDEGKCAAGLNCYYDPFVADGHGECAKIQGKITSLFFIHFAYFTNIKN